MSKPAHKWTPELVAKVLALAKSEDISLALAARRLGLNPNSFREALKRARKDGK
jgi:transposase-like protein